GGRITGRTRADDDAVGVPPAAQRRGGRSDEEEWRHDF
ncbi:MAG TPA: hypothetical protein VGC05_06235, partial [Mycobacterium sp.]